MHSPTGPYTYPQRVYHIDALVRPGTLGNAASVVTLPAFSRASAGNPRRWHWQLAVRTVERTRRLAHALAVVSTRTSELAAVRQSGLLSCALNSTLAVSPSTGGDDEMRNSAG